MFVKMNIIEVHAHMYNNVHVRVHVYSRFDIHYTEKMSE